MKHPIGADWVIGFVVAVLFLLPLLWVGPADQEEYQHVIFSSLIHFKNLLRGAYLFWYDGLGLGTPLHLGGGSMNHHPLFLLSPVISLRLVLTLLWTVHLTIAGVYVLRLCADLAIARPIALVVLFSYVLSAATLNYAYTDDWPAVFLTWTMLPVLVLYLQRFLTREDASPVVAALRLALLFAFTILNGNPGHQMVVYIVLAVFVLFHAYDRPRLLAWLAFIGIVVATMVSERLYYLATEAVAFPAHLERNVRGGYDLLSYLTVALRPLTSNVVSALAGSATLAELMQTLVAENRAVRLPFVGAVFLVAATTTAAWLVLAMRMRTDGQRAKTAVALCFVVSVVLSVFGESIFRNSLGVIWFFRDPMILFALLAAGIGLSVAWRLGGRVRVAVIVLVVGHCIQMVSFAAPVVINAMRGDSMAFFRGVETPGAFAVWLTDAAASHGARLYLSPAAEALFRRQLAPEGLYALTDLSRLGLAPVNGWFKGVSMDPLYPSTDLMQGRIRGELDVIDNGPLLDVLGVGLVLVLEDDLSKIRTAGTLRQIGSFDTRTLVGNKRFVLLANPDHWNRASVLAPSAAKFVPAKRHTCSHDRFLCADLADLAAAHLDDTVTIAGRHGDLTLTLAPATAPRLVVVSQLYRVEWRAEADGRRLVTRAVAGALLGIDVPAGVAAIDLGYRPAVRGILLLVSWLAIGLCLGVFLWRRRQGSADAARGIDGGH